MPPTMQDPDLSAQPHKIRRINTLVKIGLSYLHMSLVVRKPVFGVSDQVRHKPGCTSTEDG